MADVRSVVEVLKVRNALRCLGAPCLQCLRSCHCCSAARTKLTKLDTFWRHRSSDADLRWRRLCAMQYAADGAGREALGEWALQWVLDGGHMEALLTSGGLAQARTPRSVHVWSSLRSAALLCLALRAAWPRLPA